MNDIRQIRYGFYQAEDLTNLVRRQPIDIIDDDKNTLILFAQRRGKLVA
jgi:hypothetical protein